MTVLDAETKQRIQSYFDSGDITAGHAALKQSIQKDLNLATAEWALQFVELLDQHQRLTRFNIAMLRSYTLEVTEPLLKAIALVYDVKLDIWLGEFNAFAQEMIIPESALYKQSFDAVYLGILSRDICPLLWDGEITLEQEEGKNEFEKAQDLLESIVSSFRAYSSLPLIVQGFEQIPYQGPAQSFDKINNKAFAGLQDNLLAIVTDNKSIYTTNYNELVSYHGYNEWFDVKKWRQASQNVSAKHLGDFAFSIMHYILPLAIAPAKVIVTDLDNTLWHGVIGEDGVEGIKISDKGKNGGHRSYQQCLKEFRRSGFLLAVASKNNLEDAENGIDNHPDMLLSKEDFTLIKANWDDKAKNIQAIADELNLGLGSVIFVDDNPLEREAVARTLPEVTVIELPETPSEYKRALLKCPRLSMLVTSAEDKNKAQQYKDEGRRKKAMAKAGDLSSFLQDLDMRLEIAEVSDSTLARSAQLTQKTNQFNVTTFRYTENDIQGFIKEIDKYKTFIVHARDRFGDHGWIALAIVKLEDHKAMLDSFLMSCRVLGRGVESALLSYIARDLKNQNFTELQAALISTKKNEPSRDVFERHGFARVDELSLVAADKRMNNDGTSLWILDLQSQDLPIFPTWINLETSSEKLNQKEAV